MTADTAGHSVERHASSGRARTSARHVKEELTWPPNGSRTARPRVAGDMPRTLRQLWIDEDDAHERELARKQRATRLRSKQSGRLRSSVVIPRKTRAR